MDEDRARHHGRHSELGGPTGSGGDDLFIALPDDVIILILVRLRCSRTAVRTGALSRRWLGLWSHLPDLVFRDVAPGSLLAALSSLGACGVPISLLDIDVPAAVQDKVRANHVGTRTGLRSSLRLRRRPASYVSSLLRAAGKFSPAAFRFNHPHQLEKPFLDVDLSTCFQGTTSIELHAKFLCFPDPQSELPALQRLSLSGCCISLASLVPLCPRLHMLRVADAFLQPDGFAIRSASLQELVVENNVVKSTIQCIHIIVDAPVLKRFTMSLRTRGDLSISVSAPLVDKVSWRCLYTGSTAGLGLWGLSTVRLETEESKGAQEEDDVPRVHVLCLHMFARVCLYVCLISYAPAQFIYMMNLPNVLKL
jgi:hypothetical protein